MKLALSLLLACAGCGADPAPAAGQQFLGTWSFTSGSDDVSCPNGTTSTATKGSITIKTASGGGLLVLDAEGCNFSYTLSGQSALLGDQKSCSFPVPELGQGVTADVTYDLITLTTSDGKNLVDSFNGKVHYNAASGGLDCIFSGSAMLAKVSSQ